MKAVRLLVPLSPVPPTAGRTLDAQLHLMDRQVLDNDGVPVTTVDDLELSGSEAETEIPPGTPPPVLTALLTGPVLGTRIFGGRPPSSRLIRIPWKDVAEVGVVIRLGVNGENLDAGWVERWIRDKIISRIPGGRHDPR
jgi:sporulation protein YlmC with PRC-barrel domain